MKTWAWVIVISIMPFGQNIAQIKKKVVPVGGVVYFSKTVDEFHDHFINLIVNPKAGYYISDRDAVGLSFYFDYYRGERSFDSVTYVTKNKEYGIFPFWRRNVFYDDTKGAFVETRLGFIAGNSKPKTIYLSVELRPGLYYFVTKRLAVETSIGGIEYSYDIIDHGELGKGVSNGISASFGLSSIFLGFQYYFNKE